MSTNTYSYNLGQIFDNVARQMTSNTALKYHDGKCFSYGELNCLSNKIANYLIDNGIERGDVIAILNNKSNFSYSLMLACLKIGVIYTNLDPKSPIERFKKMLHICTPKILFHFGNTETLLLDGENDFGSMLVINYECIQFNINVDKRDSLFPYCNLHVTSNSPAYIMFTSGSTGFPKGVLINHTQIINFVNWSKLTYSSTENDVFTNINPMHFDNSVFDFYASLFIGATLIPVSDQLTRNPRRLLDALNTVSPTIWFSVPSMLVFILNMRALKDNDLPTLRIVSFGGEGFPKSKLRILWEKWSNRISFINVYGPTECTCICSSYEVTNEDVLNDDLLPLGPIAPNFYALVVDENGQVIKNGEIGELCIGGANVGLGYFNNIEKTKEVFVNNPCILSHTELIYKSGDLVRYESDKNLYYFCGRRDNQIKRMGYRIELEEIENALNSLSIVSESAVVYLNTNKIKEKLIACVCSEKQDEHAIAIKLTNLLPNYMMPDKYIWYEYLPKNQNGKIDRLKLKEECNF
jgi:D-alanine--poly(phosphoribitol) ligase subunit 1